MRRRGREGGWCSNGSFCDEDTKLTTCILTQCSSYIHRTGRTLATATLAAFVQACCPQDIFIFVSLHSKERNLLCAVGICMLLDSINQSYI